MSTIRFADLPQGDDRTIFLAAEDAEGVPLDLTGATLRAVIVSGGRVAATAQTPGVGFVQLGAAPASGQYVLELSDELTAELPDGTLAVEVKARLASGSVVTLLRAAQLPVVRSAIGSAV